MPTAAYAVPVPFDVADPSDDTVTAHPLTDYQIIRRNGAVVAFEPSKIAVAMMKAFLAVHGTQGAASASVREAVDTSRCATAAGWPLGVQASSSVASALSSWLGVAMAKRAMR